MRLLPFALLPALVPALTGCGELFGDKDAHQPGDALGTFHVVGTRTTNQCGEGALGATATWEFDVDLARDEGAVYWDNGAQVLTGALDDDGVTFSIDATVVVDMRDEATAGYPPCSIARTDAARCALDDAGDDVEAFSGTLRYDFAPTTGSSCGDLVLNGASEFPPAGDPVFETLPCGMVYELAATRTAAPPE
jgi:hypothetical protein